MTENAFIWMAAISLVIAVSGGLWVGEVKWFRNAILETVFNIVLLLKKLYKPALLLVFICIVVFLAKLIWQY